MASLQVQSIESVQTAETAQTAQTVQSAQSAQSAQTEQLITLFQCNRPYNVAQNPKCQLDGCNNDADSLTPNGFLGLICANHRTLFKSFKCFREENFCSFQCSPQINVCCSLQWRDDGVLYPVCVENCNCGTGETIKCQLFGCSREAQLKKDGTYHKGCCKFHSCIIDRTDIDQNLCFVKGCIYQRKWNKENTYLFPTCSYNCANILRIACVNCDGLGEGYCRCDKAYGRAGNVKYHLSKLATKPCQ